MNPPTQTPAPAPRRHVWRWVFLAAGICLTPFVILGAVALSFISLDRNAATLRNRVMDATDSGWHTKVQLSVGGVTLGAARQVLRFIHAPDIDEARLALSAVHRASVGVYEADDRK